MTTPHNDLHLAVDGVVVRHGASVLAEVGDLHLAPGRPVTIVGESGSGKSVLAHALMGTLSPDLNATGSMRVGSTTLDLADPRGHRRLWGRQMALLPQEPALALDPTMRVRAQVAEGAAGWRPGSTVSARLAGERLAHLGLAGAAGAWPHTLSGGMAQRVAYAAATIGGAPVLIVDEPTKGLDAEAIELLAGLLDDHLARGGLLLMITHDLGLARRVGGTVMVMRAATVVESGPAADVLSTPSHAYTRSLVAAEPAHWTFPWMRSTPPDDRTVPPLISARSITKSYADRRLFDELDLEIRPRERWAVTGPSGAGKTTLGNALLGLTAVDRGSVSHAPETGGGRLQKLYQDPALSFPRGVPLHLALGDVVKRHHVSGARVPSLLGRMGLSPAILQRRPTQVSGGELQRIAIVRAMLPRPVLVFADEATSRLDLISQRDATDLLLSELEEAGCGLLTVTHDRDLAAAVAHPGLCIGLDGSDGRPVREDAALV